MVWCGVGHSLVPSTPLLFLRPKFELLSCQPHHTTDSWSLWSAEILNRFSQVLKLMHYLFPARIVVCLALRIGIWALELIINNARTCKLVLKHIS